ncbi:MAG TPA: hypothetical protein VFX65_10970, partial [Candidatus Limnocylindrales bacterium]|nr:hypothetical protein [Candidatus Limnocylindrales bacterium]
MSKRRRTEQRAERQAPFPPTPSRPASRAARDALIEAAAPGLGWLPIFTAAVVGAMAFVLYLITLSPTVGTGDSGELTAVAATLGLA